MICYEGGMARFLAALRLFMWMTLLTGVVYPLLVTVIAHVTMRHQAEGSLVFNQSKQLVGSELIGQQFKQERYFWGRPSASDYNPLNSGGSNWGPTSTRLKDAVQSRMIALSGAHHVEPIGIPHDLLFASGSGLDPDITLASAFFQVDRVAKARGLEDEAGRARLKAMIRQRIQGRNFGIYGLPHINVLLLNQALDEAIPMQNRRE